MAKKETIEVEGKVTEPLPNDMFKVQLADGHEVLAHLGRDRQRQRDQQPDQRSDPRPGVPQ